MTHKYYADEPSFHVAVDCIIFGFEDGNLQVLFQHRNIEPFNGELTPMGGFVQEDETLDEAAYRVLTERTGIKDLFLEQLEAFGDINRDPGGRVISVAYYALLDKAHYDNKLLEKFNCKWVDAPLNPDTLKNQEKRAAEWDAAVAAFRERLEKAREEAVRRAAEERKAVTRVRRDCWCYEHPDLVREGIEWTG